MRDGLRILDADRHVIEPVEMWREYLPPEYRAGAPYQELLAPRESLPQRAARLGPKGLLPVPPTLMLDGQPAWNKVSERAHVEMAWTLYQRQGSLAVGASPQGQLRAMERTGLDVAFLYPTSALFLLRIDSMAPERATAFTRAYNDWLRDFCRANPERLRAVGAIPLHDPAAMVPELERVAGFGWKAVVLPPNPVRGRTLSHPDHEPFWSACERLGIAVALHEGTHARLPATGADRFDTRFAMHACSHPMEQMMALLALIEGGVLERHPALRVGFLEAGCGWLPSWLWRLDEVAFKYMGGEVAANVRRKPSEYFRRQCFIALEPGEPGIEAVVRAVGPDCLLVGTDFPHVDHDDAIVDEMASLRARLPEDVVRKLLWDNPARFYGLAPGVSTS
ncbi:amidohydrolase [Corallococcus sp. H22C18031201]|uniref:amidohydrolase family protein n=1 Tax=Citreicoccus inhibens TaxID=2849499 RepID=UPI000E766905|nr:amidohydrolase family protein [Citreicoccus inhibens]MBU8898649.1 amidohydrolase [Citreicoccus inhibens]RJS15984.1 amidohydrolase [Corallococcus sp. H22C18031201]